LAGWNTKFLAPRDHPSDDFIAQLQAFCELDDVPLAVWFESTSDFESYTPELPPNISASALLPDQFI
jgi:hypothetical protein